MVTYGLNLTQLDSYLVGQGANAASIVAINQYLICAHDTTETGHPANEVAQKSPRIHWAQVFVASPSTSNSDTYVDPDSTSSAWTLTWPRPGRRRYYRRVDRHTPGIRDLLC